MQDILKKLNKAHEKTHPFALGFFEVNLKNIEENILKIKNNNNIENKNITYLLPVKGGGYGCGMCEISYFVQEKKLVDYLGVAHTQEAFELRKYGITLPILLLGQTQYSTKFLEFISKENIDMAISEEDTLTKIEEFCTQNNISKKFSVHLKIDLGMGRCGILYKKVFDLFQKIYTSKYVKLTGVMMHFPVSDSDRSDTKNFEYTEKQIAQFSKIQSKIKLFYQQENKISIFKNIIFHTANSGASTEHPNASFNMIRPGIASYGYPEPGTGAEQLHLQPAVKVYSHFSLIKNFPKNFSIGYGRTYSTKHENEKIGIIPIGYADGLNRLLSNNFSLYSEAGEEYASVGRISMDQSAYLLPHSSIPFDKKVYILGKQQNARELAQKLHTISYEVLLSLGTSNRLKKVYVYK